MKSSRYQVGAVHASIIAIILLSVGLVGMMGFGIWSYLQYSDYRDNFESKKELAVTEAVKEQADLDEEKFLEREKEPSRQFVGPDDYGRVTFKYPKTWSAHVASDVSDGRGTYEAYLHPIVVPPISNEEKFALRVTIEEKTLDDVLESYERRVEDGDLKTSAVTSGELSGTRIDGNFSDTLRGSAVLFKIRDKTLIIRTDANTFKKDFDTIIKTIDFNK